MAISLPEVFGLPPSTIVSDDVLKNSMPVAEIFPSRPAFVSGLNIFTLEDAWDTGKGSDPSYSSLLNDHGYSVEGKSIKVAFLADNFPTDTFTNEYGESFLQKFTDVASEGAAAISQFFGARTAGEAFNTATERLIKAGGVAGAAGTAAKSAGQQVKSVINNLGLGGPGGTVSSLLAGARVDFPQIWKNSGYQPSYTMTIRLYNPEPRSSEATEKYIIGPLAALLLLGIPISRDGNTYNWPFLHRVSCPGIYNLNPGFISNITVIKGGDQQQISYNQRMGIVDVRIDFGSLYNSILAGGNLKSGRPTLKTYLKSLKEKRSTLELKSPPTEREPLDNSGIVTSKALAQTSVTSAIESTVETIARRVSTSNFSISESLLELQKFIGD